MNTWNICHVKYISTISLGCTVQRIQMMGNHFVRACVCVRV